MSTATDTPRTTEHTGRVTVAALLGVAAYGLALASGEAFDLNSDSTDAEPTTAGEWALGGLLAVIAAVIAIWLGRRAWHGTPALLSRTALGLGIAAAVTFVAFWSGWPIVFGAVAVVLALEHRSRTGGFLPSTTVAAVLGGLAAVAATVVCVIG